MFNSKKLQQVEPISKLKEKAVSPSGFRENNAELVVNRANELVTTHIFCDAPKLLGLQKKKEPITDIIIDKKIRSSLGHREMRSNVNSPREQKNNPSSAQPSLNKRTIKSQAYHQANVKVIARIRPISKLESV